MTSSTAALEQGKQIPNWVIKDHAGQKHTLWDYRQKSHVVLLYSPESRPETVERWLSAIQADRKQWEWLNVKFLVVSEGPKGLVPGAYAIDRYGIFINRYAAANWGFDDLEKEFLYYEARHC
jgi:hypothetical protein